MQVPGTRVPVNIPNRQTSVMYMICSTSCKPAAELIHTGNTTTYQSQGCHSASLALLWWIHLWQVPSFCSAQISEHYHHGPPQCLHFLDHWNITLSILNEKIYTAIFDIVARNQVMTKQTPTCNSVPNTTKKKIHYISDLHKKRWN